MSINKRGNESEVQIIRNNHQIVNQKYTPEKGMQILARMIAEAYLEEIGQSHRMNENQHELPEKFSRRKKRIS